MPIVDFGRIDSDASQEDILNAIAKIQKGIDYLMQGGLDSKNAREFGGWLVGNTELQSINKTVGMSTEDTTDDDIRFWAGDLKLGSPKYKVTKSGILYAVDGNFKGHIDAESGTIGGFAITLTKLSGAGIIEGGTIRTAAPGNKRIELAGGTLKGYYSNDQLHGLVFNPSTTSNFFDLFLYHDGTQMLEFYDEGTMIKLRPGSGTSSWSLGKSGGTTYLDGQWIFNSTASLNLGPNTATGTVQYANYATSAGSSGTASSVDWANVTNHPDATILPVMNGTAAIGTSSQYAKADHSHPTDTSRQATITGAATTITTSNLAVSKSLVSDANGKVSASSVTSAELGYIGGVTSAIQTQIDGKASKTLPSWIAPTLTNGWVNLDSGFSPAEYFKDDRGIVYLRGILKSGTVGTSMFNLPAGYRPAYHLRVPTVSNDIFGQVEINISGNVICMNGSNVFFSIDGISYRAEQ